jgi:Na+-transporting methylmalonyl-CoA/oxaloacetate decarboxylase gamma subunit
MEIYYFIFFAVLIYFLFFLSRKIVYFINFNHKMRKIKFEKYQNNDKEKEDECKNEKFKSVLKQRHSRLDKILACKNS